jgi:hypothetical protein
MPPRAAVVLFLVSLAHRAVAEEAAAKKSGVFLAASAGWGMPLGKLGDVDGTGESPKLSNPMAALAPLALELGYQLIPQLSVSATFQYAFGFLNNCSDCSSRDLYAGANVAWHFTPDGALTGWAALGAGYERLSFSRHAALGGLPIDIDTWFSGPVFLNGQVGGDIATSPRISMGGFLAVSVGVYESLSGSLTIDDRTESMSQDIARTNVHAWVTLGVRGRFDL